MNETAKGVEALSSEIRMEIRAIYKMNMTFEGWNVPEMDDRVASEKILEVMQQALDELKQENK
ncbi:MAG: hypothetical protein R3331_03170 [Sulfurospirillaceae bacterium]|nr:hypothetical protein [Sulfurospirillaceae bacterium]